MAIETREGKIYADATDFDSGLNLVAFIVTAAESVGLRTDRSEAAVLRQNAAARELFAALAFADQ